ncbi:MAG: phosphomannomutase/phosphoglucomutase [Roseiflexus sp.]|nr:phosphomannomutase/phosphoglucomutase [Roseiflexus sp.]MCS7287970.1 phosphomannomutase/phosphoglucomutase [Roseiflexus sp.]MDW8233527.1 phosphomannomutase/phosphoglucomutase [Roseiflexaceae bacterium]
MTNVHPSIFRAYDIRGVVDRDLSEEVYRTLGRASGTFFRRHERRRIVVARDARLTSPAYAAALIDGLRRSGCDVIDIGMAPTPLMYFAVSFLHADGGAVVTASHNPPHFNGLKLRLSDPVYGGTPLSSDQIQEVGQIAISGAFVAGDGAYEKYDAAEDYVHDVTRHISLKRKPKVVLDGGNGVAGPLGVRTLEAIGCEVVPLFIEPDGTFPNHHPDPLKEENVQDLIRVVRETGADMGIGLDGDGDRLGVVDGNGEIVLADRYLIVLARQALARGPAPIVFDVKCSVALIDAIRAFGGTPVMWKTGYSNLSAKMREVNAPLAGELSGHVFGAVEHHCHDDGIFAGCMLLDALEKSGQTLAEALAPFPPLPSLPEGRLPFDDEMKFRAIEFVRDYFAARYPVIDVDGVRVDFGDGWGILRASNTEPAITTRFEARTPERLYEIRDLMIGKLHEFAPAKAWQ